MMPEPTKSKGEGARRPRQKLAGSQMKLKALGIYAGLPCKIIGENCKDFLVSHLNA